MINHRNDHAKVCIIGRTSFDTGIGAISHAACELFSRHVPTCIIPTDRPSSQMSPIFLPSGRTIPICTEPLEQKIFFFTDILYNGAYDTNLRHVPEHGVKLAHICFDSDELPTEWVCALNDRFDGAYLPSVSQRNVALKSGVRIPLGVLPFALPLENLMVQPLQAAYHGVRIGSISAFHERKELVRLIEAFITEFEVHENVELILHSNLSFGTELDRLMRFAESAGDRRIKVSSKNLDGKQRDELLESFDIFVNCSRGEGYSMGAREALALGKVLVLSDIGAHCDLFGLTGVYSVKTRELIPGHYPEIDGRVFGQQTRPDEASLRAALRRAVDEFGETSAFDAAMARRRRASDFSFGSLSIEYATVIDPHANLTRTCSRTVRSTDVNHSTDIVRSVNNAGGRFARNLALRQQIVVPAHDGGFFSVFNSYMSHLVWSIQDDRCHRVLPDWDQSRLSESKGTDDRDSFCYGKFEDGNIWTHFFDAPFGCTNDELNDPEFLYSEASIPPDRFNVKYEPLLTHLNAFDLYRSPWFRRFRFQYHDAFTRYIHLNASITDPLTDFFDTHIGSRFLMSAHVRHQSHTIEQIDGRMPDNDAYYRAIRKRLSELRIDSHSDNWRLFLATDQANVVNAFTQEFEDNVISIDDVRRTTAAEDENYQAVIPELSSQSGFQAHHLAASSPAKWTVKMGIEILRDATMLSRADTCFHIVSNVATAASYMNPKMRMIFVEPTSS